MFACCIACMRSATVWPCPLFKFPSPLSPTQCSTHKHRPGEEQACESLLLDCKLVRLMPSTVVGRSPFCHPCYQPDIASTPTSPNSPAMPSTGMGYVQLMQSLLRPGHASTHTYSAGPLPWDLTTPATTWQRTRGQERAQVLIWRWLAHGFDACSTCGRSCLPCK